MSKCRGESRGEYIGKYGEECRGKNRGKSRGMYRDFRYRESLVFLQPKSSIIKNNAHESKMNLGLLKNDALLIRKKTLRPDLTRFRS